MQRVLAVILGGGKGERLFPLTKYRSKPAVPVGGKYRLIDVPISNCINSDLNRIFVLTQFNSASLNRHLSGCYRFDHFSAGFVEVLAAQQTMEGSAWYQGTADAVRQQLHQFEPRRCSHMLILSGDHLYRMDYRPYLAQHIALDADVTVAATPIPLRDAARFGILKQTSSGGVEAFVEKPPKPADYKDWTVPAPKGGRGQFVLASMGIYLFKWPVIRDLMIHTAYRDFGSEIFPHILGHHKIGVYRFDGYWEDIGTIGSFYEANLKLTWEDTPFSFYDPVAPVYSNPRFLPPMKADHCHIDRCLVCEGAMIHDTEISDSIIGIRSIIGQGTKISRSIIMGADYYEKEERRERDHKMPVGIGRHCLIENAIIDKNVRMGDNVQIINAQKLDKHIGEMFCVRDGIVVIPKDVQIPSGTVI